MNYHSHTNRDEVWTVVSGTGYTIIDGQKQIVRPGDVLREYYYVYSVWTFSTNGI